MNENTGNIDSDLVRTRDVGFVIRDEAPKGPPMTNICFGIIFAIALASGALTLKIVLDEYIRRKRYYNIDHRND